MWEYINSKLSTDNEILRNTIIYQFCSGFDFIINKISVICKNKVLYFLFILHFSCIVCSLAGTLLCMSLLTRIKAKGTATIWDMYWWHRENVSVGEGAVTLRPSNWMQCILFPFHSFS